MAKPVTKEEFAAIKRQLIVFRTLGGQQRVARKARRSPKTIVQIKYSKTFADYQEQNKAQHPPEIVFSLAENIKMLHRLTFAVPGEAYVEKSARLCILELLDAKRKG